MSSLTAADVLSEGFLAELLPFLTFGASVIAFDAPVGAPVPCFRAALLQRGFIRQTAQELWADAFPEAVLTALSHGVAVLVECGLPLALLSMSREAQAVAAALKAVVAVGLGVPHHASLGDWAFFNVDAAAEGKGWPPHRDRPRHEGALEADGTPNYVTCWVPLSHATPYTSCLYFVPRAADPGYERGDACDDSSGGGVTDGAACTVVAGGGSVGGPLSRVFARPDAWQAIAAMPTGRGGLLCFSSRTLHWGSAPLAPVEGEARARAPRQALSIAFAAASFERPALTRAGACEDPTFLESAVLAAAQALVYSGQAPLPEAHARAFLEVLARHGAALLEAGYLARALKAGNWACFTRGLSERVGPEGPPSAATVALAFAGLAAAEAGFGAASYI